MKELVLKIQVVLDQIIEVNGNCGDAVMITFHGNCDCPNFCGKIMPGAADTQLEKRGEQRTLSARYMLQGYDAEGQNCSIFIENNGMINKEGEIVTRPKIVTDSKYLAWLEQAALIGQVIGIDEKNIEIWIWQEDK